MAAEQSIFSNFKHFLDKRLLTVFLFGVSSGFPWVMIGSALSAYLKEEGFSRSSIGLFGLVFAVYSVNFLWAPFVDRLKVPVVRNLLGHRRSWVLSCQIMIVLACVAMSQISLGDHLFYFALAALILAITSATQDIAIDGYRIDIIGSGNQEKIAAAAGMATAGWWTGYAFLGSIAFFAIDIDGWGWNHVYLLLAAVMASFLLVVLFLAKEPAFDRDEHHKAIEEKYQKWFGSNNDNLFEKFSVWIGATVLEPFLDFFRRNNIKVALSILGFIILFKIGEAFLARMSIVFYKEVGFSNSDIGYYSKLLGGGTTIFFTLLGSLFTMRFGIVKGLFLGGVAMAASNLMFAAIAMVGPNKTLFFATIIVDGYTTAWSTVAFVSFISMLCNRAFSASQYALMASLGTVGRTFIGSSSGFMVDALDGNWAVFFVLTALMVIPGLVILHYLRHELNAIEAQHKQSLADKQ